jgi:plastocyanin
VEPNSATHHNKKETTTQRKATLTIVLILVAALTTIGIVLVLDRGDNTTQQPQAQNATPTEAVIEITPNGFMPSTLRVKSGTKVTWRNSTEEPRRVAADPYLTHDSFPDLDSLEALSQNDTFSFVFADNGQYRYHENSRPNDFRGVVIVE